MTDADVIVLGGGLAGFACARASAEFGAKVILVDGGDWRESQSLRSILPHALLAQLVTAAPEGVGGRALYRSYLGQRDLLIGQTIDGLQRVMDALGITRIVDRGAIETLQPMPVVETADARLEATHLVLAVGARFVRPAWAGPGTPVVTADDVYLRDGPLPERLIILGGGYVGVGQALLFHALGVDVALVFEEDEPLPGFDARLRAHLSDGLIRRGIRLRPGTAVRAVVPGSGRCAVETSAGVLAGDLVAFSGGSASQPSTSALGLDRFGVNCTPEGAVFVDTRYQSSVAGLHAIGDCADHAGQGLDPRAFDLGPVAEAEGKSLAQQLFGDRPAPLDYERVPLAVPGPWAFGSVGLGGERAAELGFDVKVATTEAPGNAPFAGLVVDGETDEVLGCQLIGPGADELIHRVGAAISRSAKRIDLLPALQGVGVQPSPLVEELVAQSRAVG